MLQLINKDILFFHGFFQKLLKEREKNGSTKTSRGIGGGGPGGGGPFQMPQNGQPWGEEGGPKIIPSMVEVWIFSRTTQCIALYCDVKEIQVFISHTTTTCHIALHISALITALI